MRGIDGRLRGRGVMSVTLVDVPAERPAGVVLLTDSQECFGVIGREVIAKFLGED